MEQMNSQHGREWKVVPSGIIIVESHIKDNKVVTILGEEYPLENLIKHTRIIKDMKL